MVSFSTGDCNCFNGFYGDDCSVPRLTAPTLSNLGNAGVCDIKSGTCTSVTVSGNNFYDSPLEKLLCKFQPVIIEAAVTVDASKIYVTADATFVSSDQVTCTIPATLVPNQHKWAVHVSVTNNDEDTISNTLTLVAFDPKCYACDVTSCMVSLFQ